MGRLITFETAKLIKEKRFDFFNYDEAFDENGVSILRTSSFFNSKKYNIKRYSQSDILNYLLENYGIHISIIPDVKYGVVVWNSQIYNIRNYNLTYNSFLPEWGAVSQSSIEDAIEVSLYKIIKSIK